MLLSPILSIITKKLTEHVKESGTQPCINYMQSLNIRSKCLAKLFAACKCTGYE